MFDFLNRLHIGLCIILAGRIGIEFALVVNRLLETVGGFFVVFRDVRPDVESICFGERRKNVTAHPLDRRHAAFIAWISRRACWLSINSPRSACK